MSIFQGPDEASLYRAVQLAARDLPAGFQIHIHVEQGAGWVELDDDVSNFEYLPDGGGMTLSEQIQECVAQAKEEARRLGR